MGLKTNKATKTSTLNCQYVGSFPVKDGDRKLSVVEQNKYVDEKLRNSTKKLLEGMPVCLQVSPDGIQVLASDEKTVKMAHTLRRVSYATVEPTNKLFAYVSHQPRTDMEVVCHTFLTKKKEHAEGLSAALGKLFKQTFAYTLKRRDKLEEAVQKRGANRRWAKHQVAEGHIALAKNEGNTKTRSADVNEQRKENGVAARTVAQQKPNQSTTPSSTATDEMAVRKTRRTPPGIPNGSASFESDSPFSSTSATAHPTPNQSRQTQPVSPTTPPESKTPFAAQSGPTTSSPNQSTAPSSTATDEMAVRKRRRTPPGIPNGSTSFELDSPFSSAATVHPPPNQSRQTQPVSPTAPSEWKTPFAAQLGPTNSSHPTSTFDGNNSFTPSSLTTSETQPPALPSRSRPPCSITQPFQADLPPALPRRNPARRLSTPSSPEGQFPPPLPRRHSSDSNVAFGALRSVDVSPSATRRDSGAERNFSAPDLILASAPHTPARVSRSSDSSIESLPTHRPVSKDLEDAATVFLADVGVTPPPLPPKGRQAGTQPSQKTATIPEEVIGPEEDEELKRRVRDEPRVSLTLEDEDWYIPGVTREIVTEMLETSDMGTFLVRDSQSRPGCYALTMKVIQSENNPSGFGNYLISPEGDGFSLQGFDKTFPDISALIRHYASYDDGLPCRLLLAGSNPLFHDSNGYLVEFMDEEDDKYSTLSDCTSMFREINMNNPW